MQATICSGTGSNPRITAGDTRRTYCALSKASPNFNFARSVNAFEQICTDDNTNKVFSSFRT